MAEQKISIESGFFDSIDGDRKYAANEMNRPYKRVITEGVFATPRGTPSTDLQVLSGNDYMNLIIKKGEGLLGGKWFENTADEVMTVSNNTGIVPRIDSIIIQMDNRQVGRVANIVCREGTPNSTPKPPAINTVDNVVEKRIANIYVASGANWLNQDAITDLRGSAECLWITSLIQQVDTSTLYTQWQNAYQGYYNDQTEAFNAFMKSLTEQLTVNTNLLMYTSSYTSVADGETVIPINIPTYNKDKDVLIVDVNRLTATLTIDYKISADGKNITLTKDIYKNNNVNFIVLQSVVVGDTETILMEIQKFNTALNTTRITALDGSAKLNVTSTTTNVLDAFIGLGLGFHTIYAANGVLGLPNTGAYRLFGHRTNDTSAYIFAMQANGSAFTNYYNGGEWRGWITIHETTPEPLYFTAIGAFPIADYVITPTKPLAQCQHGWELVFTAYDDTNKVARDFYMQTVRIPKRSYKNVAWSGESTTFQLVSAFNDSTDTITSCTKTFTVYPDRIVSSQYNSLGKSRGMVIRAIYEY